MKIFASDTFSTAHFGLSSYVQLVSHEVWSNYIFLFCLVNFFRLFNFLSSKTVSAGNARRASSGWAALLEPYYSLSVLFSTAVLRGEFLGVKGGSYEKFNPSFSHQPHPLQEPSTSDPSTPLPPPRLRNASIPKPQLV